MGLILLGGYIIFLLVFHSRGLYPLSVQIKKFLAWIQAVGETFRAGIGEGVGVGAETNNS